MNGNTPAFPAIGNHGNAYGGLTKREYFAGLAMQALLTREGIDLAHDLAIMSMAVGAADALLAELAK